MLDIGIFYFVCSIKPKCFLSEFFVLTVCMPNVFFLMWKKPTWKAIFCMCYFFVLHSILYFWQCFTVFYVQQKNLLISKILKRAFLCCLWTIFIFLFRVQKSMVVLSSALYIFRCIKSLLKFTKMWYRLLFGPLDWVNKLSKN